uniref:glycylpeptide N-tetradecanoyltransferase n=1 Tax=viral metagenome TaxID=1070528 RepID=A0A6C0IY63_9ZZZZ
MFNILLICLITIYYFRKVYVKKHKFWTKQPVSRTDNKSIGLIAYNPRFNINLYNKYKFKFIKVNQNTIDFIDMHFSDYNKYNYRYLYNSLNQKNCYNIGLYLFNNLIGFIHAKPVQLLLDNKYLDVFYVDFLCVHKNYRNNNLAVYLISYLINQCNSQQIFIFKKDNNKLPFNYLNKTNYYYNFIEKYEKKKIKKNIILLDNNNKDIINKVYKFINLLKKDFVCVNLYNIEYFMKNYYYNNSKNIFVEFNEYNQIISVFVTVNNYFVYEKKKLMTLDIENIYISSVNLNNTLLFDYLINYCQLEKIDIITCIDNMHNTFFIKKYNLLKSMNLYYHMYNYHYKKLKNKAMCFNLL